MFGYKEEDQYLCNCAQLVLDNASFIVPANCYDVHNDRRLLIPYEENYKIGFVDQNAVPIITPTYDRIQGNIYNQDDVIIVGTRYILSYTNNSKNKINSYERYKWGVIDAHGKPIFDTEYDGIIISDGKHQLFSLYDNSKGYCVMDRNGSIIVPYGKYNYIDGYSKGFARVKIAGQSNGAINSKDKWGIINEQGEEVLPVEYDNIWNFYEKDRQSTKVIKNGIETNIFFRDLSQLSNPSFSRQHFLEYDDFEYPTRTYSEYEGSYAQDVMHYDDETIGDAFDGEPDAYWNID